ncbi:MAG: hypothetical protein LBU04_04665 [Christensenellaceae bacterium]|nr:hypothetical protein [Christensenellaceae bacterium]
MLRKMKFRQILKLTVPVCAAICTIVIVCFAMSGVYGWFVQDINPTAQTTDLTVINLNRRSLEISLLDRDGEVISSSNLESSFGPGDYLYIRINSRVSMFDGNTRLRQFLINSLSVRYPTQNLVASVPFKFGSKYIDTDEYTYKAGGKFDIATVGDLEAQESFFRTFVTPASNAFRYSFTTQFVSSFANPSSYQYLTIAPNATSTELTPSNDFHVITSHLSNATLDLGPADAGMDYVFGSRISISSSFSNTVYLILYFDPLQITEAKNSNVDYMMNNSNGFMLQDIVLYLGFLDEIV